LAGVYGQQGKTKEAVQAAQEAAKAHPQSPLPHLTIAQVQERAGKAGEAVTAYRRVLELDRDNVMALNNLAWLLGKDGRNLGEAIALAERAYARVARSSAVADTLGWLHYHKGQLDKAEGLIKAALDANPDNPTIRYHLAVVYAKRGKNREALQELNRALKQSPNFPEAESARQMVHSLSKK
jgi:Tfp pilus assembly protein PilF